MKREDKELLLKDLSVRQIYGVKCLVNFKDGTAHIITLKTGSFNALCNLGFSDDYFYRYSNNFKPYLRPMSSMTEEEKEEYYKFYDLLGSENFELYKQIDWLNAHHFDYRGLIPMGLALEAPEGMYNF